MLWVVGGVAVVAAPVLCIAAVIAAGQADRRQPRPIDRTIRLTQDIRVDPSQVNAIAAEIVSALDGDPLR